MLFTLLFLMLGGWRFVKPPLPGETYRLRGDGLPAYVHEVTSCPNMVRYSFFKGEAGWANELSVKNWIIRYQRA